jgi:hypothetical protein
MASHDWIDEVPACDDVYMYQAALHCEDCGEAIRADLRKSGKAPEDEDDEDSYDSDDFPKGPFGAGGGEADSVQHCDGGTRCLNAITLPHGSKIGAWLGNDLTEDGISGLSDSIRRSLFKTDPHVRQVNRLWATKYGDSLPDATVPGPVSGRDLASPTVTGFIKSIGGLGTGLDDQVWFDRDHLYGFALHKANATKRLPASLMVWRSEFESNGDPGTPQKVELPITEAGEREALEILEELIGDCAWD